jgi:hypothetical protein
VKPYRNHSGESGVVAYEIGADAIKVRFTNGTTYVYDVDSVGRRNLATMKKLAEAGSGLSTFISQHVHDRFASKY